ncbi:hypothetical protein A2U01_0084629, partial [Trifolium medium]|nr:hypothetical protein [Trifolium medium]
KGDDALLETGEAEQVLEGEPITPRSSEKDEMGVSQDEEVDFGGVVVPCGEKSLCPRDEDVGQPARGKEIRVTEAVKGGCDRSSVQI